MDVNVVVMDPLTEVTVATDTPAKLAAAVSLLPRSICCNCGASEGLTVVKVALRFKFTNSEYARLYRNALDAEAGPFIRRLAAR